MGETFVIENSATNPTAPASHFNALGGAPAIREAVDRFYRMVMDDPELAPYFAGVDVGRLKGHQAALLTKVLGGPDGYAGRDLGTAHRGLGVTDAHYDRVCEYLVRALRAVGAGDEVIRDAGATLAAVRSQIVTAPDLRRAARGQSEDTAGTGPHSANRSEAA